MSSFISIFFCVDCWVFLVTSKLKHVWPKSKLVQRLLFLRPAHLCGNVSVCGRVWGASHCRRELCSRRFSSWLGGAECWWSRGRSSECLQISAQTRPSSDLLHKVPVKTFLPCTACSCSCLSLYVTAKHLHIGPYSEEENQTLFFKRTFAQQHADWWGQEIQRSAQPSVILWLPLEGLHSLVLWHWLLNNSKHIPAFVP